MGDKAPKKCPRCKASLAWQPVQKGRENFSVGKAIVGTAFLGPLGAIAGKGKKKVIFQCAQCGFIGEYDD